MKVLTVGYGRLGYGYGTVLSELFSRVALAKIEIIHLDLASMSKGAAWSKKTYSAGVNDRYGQESIRKVVFKENPDIVFLYTEIAILEKILENIPPENKVLVYLTMDTSLPDKIKLPYPSKRLRFIVINNSHREILSDLLDDDYEISTLSHGVNKKAFHKLPGSEKTALRRKYWGHYPSIEDAFIVFNGNRNTERKRIDLTIEGFAKFYEETKSNSFLCLNCAVIDVGYNVARVAYENGIYDRVLMTRVIKNKGPELSVSELNEYLNMCDVGVNTSGAESFGLVSFEHAVAAMAPQIVSDTKVMKELWEDNAIFLPTIKIDFGFNYHLELPAPSDVSQALFKLWSNEEYYKKMSKKSFNHANSEVFDWDTISNELISIFKQEPHDKTLAV